MYSVSSTSTTWNNRILGDATGEIGPISKYADADGSTRAHDSWYGALTDFVDSSYPWFIRSSNYNFGALAGTFRLKKSTGGSSTNSSSRIVLANY
ncbi:MAG: hypothetical protein ACK5HP_00230 [Bacilli bacterium]